MAGPVAQSLPQHTQRAPRIARPQAQLGKRARQFDLAGPLARGGAQHVFGPVRSSGAQVGVRERPSVANEMAEMAAYLGAALTPSGAS